MHVTTVVAANGFTISIADCYRSTMLWCHYNCYLTQRKIYAENAKGDIPLEKIDKNLTTTNYINLFKERSQ